MSKVYRAIITKIEMNVEYGKEENERMMLGGLGPEGEKWYIRRAECVISTYVRDPWMDRPRTTAGRAALHLERSYHEPTHVSRIAKAKARSVYILIARMYGRMRVPAGV